MEPNPKKRQQINFGKSVFNRNLINQLNITKTLYSKYEDEEEANKNVSQTLVKEAMDDVYKRGDDVMKGFISLHLLLALIFAWFTETWQTTLTIGLSTWFIFVFIVFWKPRRFFTRAFAGIAIQVFVILHIYQFQGLGELRFFFFTAFTIMIVYQDWKALMPSFTVMLAQYILMAYVQIYGVSLGALDNIEFLKYAGKEFNTEIEPPKLGKDTVMLDYARAKQKLYIKDVSDVNTDSLYLSFNQFYEENPDVIKRELSNEGDSIKLATDYVAFIKGEHRVTENRRGVHFKELVFYLGIILFQVLLCGTWSGYLKLQTLREVRNKHTLLQNQLEIEQANIELEEKIKTKTLELREALDATISNEEELRQNMEELSATQEGMQEQAKQLLENQAEMKKVEKELRERQAEMEKSQWLESNLAKVDDVMRYNYSSNINTFSDTLMQSIAEITEATQAALYVLDDKQASINMKGGYACTPDTVKQATFMIGEGILGQTVKTKKMTYIDELPVGGAVVESGLTKINSKSLVIMPLIYNEEVQGIIEIATLGSIPDLHQEFIQRVSKNIASMLKNLRSIANTENLLKQSQEMSGKYRASAEELAKTKQEVEQKAIEFQRQFNAINQAMLVLEFDSSGYIKNVNDNFLKLAYYQKNEVIGKHQSILLDPEYVASEKYKSEWKRVQNDEFIQSEYKCLDKSGSDFWIRANYYSLGEGKNKKIMILAYDTTLQKYQEMQIKESLKDLRDKEEEMRQNIEVVESLKDQLERKAKAFKAQLNAINLSTAMVEFDSEGNILLVNDKFKEIFGYQDKEIIGKHHTLLVDNKFAKSKTYETFWKKLIHNEFIDGEFESRAKDGSEIWLRGSYYPITNNEEKVYKILLLAANISNEIQQEEQIKQHLLDLEKAQTAWKGKTETLSAQLDAIEQSTGMAEIDLSGKILSVNQKFLEYYAYQNSEELIGQKYEVLLSNDYSKSKEYKQFWKDLKANKVLEGEFEGIDKNKENIFVKASYAPVLDIHKKPIKIIALVTDIMQPTNVES